MLLLFCSAMNAQQTSSLSGSATVPRLVNFSGKATDTQGKAISGIAGATFAIYKEESGGSPLWLETQNIQADPKGNYIAQLGSTKPDGLPQDLFSSGEARWLGVTVNGGSEQPRVLLLSVPYALKAADAETVGGLPASAFVLAGKGQGSAPSSKAAPASTPATAKNGAPPANPAVTGKGVVDFIPMWDTTSDIVDSIMFQKSSQIGINTTSPAATLDVNGKSDVRDTLTLFPKGTDSTLAVNGTSFKVDQTGKVTFISGQTFPSTGTVTSVALSAPTTDFVVTGSPVTKTGTLKFAWTAAPTNANTANAIVKRDSLGGFSAGAITGTLGVTGLSGGTAAVTGTNSSSGNGVFGSSSTGTGILGESSGTSYTSIGVEGVSNSPVAYGVAGSNGSSGIGVYGTSVSGDGVYGGANSSTAYGVFGINTSTGGAGTYGIMGSPSIWGPGILPTGAGVWGDTGLANTITSSSYAGVLGTAGDAFAGVFKNNSSTGYFTLLAQSYDSNAGMLDAYNYSNNAGCSIDAGGNLNCNGSKNAVVPIDGGKRFVAMSAIESPENWFEDFGSAQLVNGVAVIQLDPDFIQTVNTEKDYRVFPVPNGDCKGLYVTNKSANSFEVRELGGGASNIRFDYRITAIRRKYETVRFADHTSDPGPRRMMEQMRKTKPASSSDPALAKPASSPLAGIPVAQLTNK
jgi:hypothetical protein